MHSLPVDVFFSCSFNAADLTVNDYFMAIARALGMKITNVSTGSSSTPPDVAKTKMGSSQAILAICTKRDEFKGGGFAMPQAVQEEIAFGYGAGIPVLMIVEDGVKMEGFKSNFGTYLPFDRSKISEPAFLEKAIEAIHSLKLEVIEPHHVGGALGVSDALSDFVHHLVELKFDSGKYIWSYSSTKKLTYIKDSKRGYPTSVWAIIPSEVPTDEPFISFEVETIASSRNMKIVTHIENHSPEKINAILKPDPSPLEGDFIEYTTVTKSRYLNPVWMEEVASGAEVHLESGDYHCADGMIFIHRTKAAIIEFRFPREYGFRKSDIRPFVGSYSSAVDYEVQSELERAVLKIDEFGGSLIVRMELSSPLPGHLYGIAWNPRPRPHPEQDQIS